MTTFGSTETEDYPDDLSPEELSGGMTRGQKTTVEGVLLEMDILKQKFEHMSENLNKVIGLVMTLQGQYEALNAARARELNLRVAHGPTEFPDADD